MRQRAELDVETLLKVVLVLVIVWIGIEILDTILDIVLGPFKSLFGLVIAALVALWLLDRL